MTPCLQLANLELIFNQVKLNFTNDFLLQLANQ